MHPREVDCDPPQACEVELWLALDHSPADFLTERCCTYSRGHRLWSEMSHYLSYGRVNPVVNSRVMFTTHSRLMFTRHRRTYVYH